MKILYFAWLRERLNRGEEEVSPPAEVVTIADLIDWLATRDEAFAFAVEKRSLIKAAIDAKLVEIRAEQNAMVTSLQSTVVDSLLALPAAARSTLTEEPATGGDRN